MTLGSPAPRASKVRSSESDDEEEPPAGRRLTVITDSEDEDDDEILTDFDDDDDAEFLRVIRSGNVARGLQAIYDQSQAEIEADKQENSRNEDVLADGQEANSS